MCGRAVRVAGEGEWKEGRHWVPASLSSLDICLIVASCCLYYSAGCSRDLLNPSLSFSFRFISMYLPTLSITFSKKIETSSKVLFLSEL